MYQEKIKRRFLQSSRLNISVSTVMELTKTLEMLAGDSTKFNTGWHAGIIAWIEKKLGRKLTQQMEWSRR